MSNMKLWVKLMPVAVTMLSTIALIVFEKNLWVTIIAGLFLVSGLIGTMAVSLIIIKEKQYNKHYGQQP